MKSGLFSRKKSLVQILLRIVPILTFLYLLYVSLRRWNGLQDANWDLLNYHAYLPAALIEGVWIDHFHPAGIHSFLAPYLDLLVWPFTTAMPGSWGTVAIGAIQLSSILPLLVILRSQRNRPSFEEALVVSLASLTGAMFVTEFGGTMGDSLAAIPALWGFSLLLRLVSDLPGEDKWFLWATTGGLFGLSVGLKLTMGYVFIGVLAVAILLLFWRKVGSAFVLIFSMTASTMFIYAPWGFLLQKQFGSPFFPMWNGYLKADRFPSTNFDDTRFGAHSLGSLLRILNAPISNPNLTSELQFFDVRWILAWITCLIVLIVLIVQKVPTANLRLPVIEKPIMVAMVFWTASTIAWAGLFGIQRYAIFLELLALPLIWLLVKGLLRNIRQQRWGFLLFSVLLICVCLTTKPVDFGRRPISPDSIIPKVDIDYLSNFDAVVIAQPPLAHLYALVRNSTYVDNQVWFSVPFNAIDAEIGKKKMLGRHPVVIAYEGQELAATNAAAAFDRQIKECQLLEAPLKNSLIQEDILLCDTSSSVGS